MHTTGIHTEEGEPWNIPPPQTSDLPPPPPSPPQTPEEIFEISSNFNFVLVYHLNL